MCRALLALAVLLVWPATSEAQTGPLPAPGSEAVPETGEVAEDELLTFVRQNAQAIEAFQAQASQNADQNMTERMESLESSIASLSQHFESTANAERAAERIRVRATLIALTRIIDRGTDLDFLSDSQNLVTSFDALTDVSQDPAIQSLVGGSHQQGDKSEMPALTQIGQLLKNPILGAVVGVARLFSSTRKPAERVEQLSEALCSLDIATTANREAGVSRALLGETSARLGDVVPRSRELLAIQLNLLGYRSETSSDLVEAYRTAIEGGAGPLHGGLDAKLNDPSPELIVAIRRQSGHALRLAGQYNEARNSYADYLTAYTAVIKRTSERSCAGTVVGFYDKRGRVKSSVPVLQSTRTLELNRLHTSSQELTTRFPTVFRAVDTTLMDRLATPQDFAREASVSQ